MPEQEQHRKIESKLPASESAAERSAELKRSTETLSENREASEQRAEQAAAEAKELAQSKEKHAPQEKQKEIAHHEAPKALRHNSYKQTMKTVQSQMSPASQSFSKIIHNPTIEKASEAIGATVARPNALLAGSICAFLAVASLYATAKFVGFSLSGFETIGAFILGWIIGLGYDLIRLTISGKR